jgi:hypothetical protein
MATSSHSMQNNDRLAQPAYGIRDTVSGRIEKASLLDRRLFICPQVIPIGFANYRAAQKTIHDQCPMNNAGGSH